MEALAVRFTMAVIVAEMGRKEAISNKLDRPYALSTYSFKMTKPGHFIRPETFRRKSGIGNGGPWTSKKGYGKSGWTDGGGGEV